MEGLTIWGFDLILSGVAGTPCWGFHTVRGGIDPGDHHFLPQYVEATDV